MSRFVDHRMAGVAERVARCGGAPTWYGAWAYLARSSNRQRADTRANCSSDWPSRVRIRVHTSPTRRAAREKEGERGGQVARTLVDIARAYRGAPGLGNCRCSPLNACAAPVPSFVEPWPEKKVARQEQAAVVSRDGLFLWPGSPSCSWFARATGARGGRGGDRVAKRPCFRYPCRAE